jgi:hypothetical protein
MSTPCVPKTTEIGKDEYIGTSLDKINTFTEDLNTDVCYLDSEVRKRVMVEFQGVRFPYEARVIDFSGNNVRATNNADNIENKTVFVPITGVTHLYSTDNWQNIGGLRLRSKKDSVNTRNPAPGVDNLGEGEIRIDGYLPTPPRQIQTFFFYGPNAATDPTSFMRSDTNNIPPVTDIQSFINDTLKHRPHNPGDIVYVVFQKTGYNVVTRASAIGGTVSLGCYSKYHEGIKCGGTFKTCATKAFEWYKQTDKYIQTLPRFIIYKLVASVSGGLLRYFISRNASNVPEIWEQTNYTNVLTIPNNSTGRFEEWT